MFLLILLEVQEFEKLCQNRVDNKVDQNGFTNQGKKALVLALDFSKGFANHPTLGALKNSARGDECAKVRHGPSLLLESKCVIDPMLGLRSVVLLKKDIRFAVVDFKIGELQRGQERKEWQYMTWY